MIIAVVVTNVDVVISLNPAKENYWEIFLRKDIYKGKPTLLTKKKGEKKHSSFFWGGGG